MDIEARRYNVENREGVLRVGQFLFREPRLYEVVQDSITQGDTGHWFIAVDFVAYRKAALGLTDGSDLGGIGEQFRRILAEQFEVDDFEAEMFWEVYQDEEFMAAHPYALDQGGSPASGGSWEGNFE